MTKKPMEKVLSFIEWPPINIVNDYYNLLRPPGR